MRKALCICPLLACTSVCACARVCVRESVCVWGERGAGGRAGGVCACVRVCVCVFVPHGAQRSPNLVCVHVCVCVCVCDTRRPLFSKSCVCVCVCVRARVYTHTHTIWRPVGAVGVEYAWILCWNGEERVGTRMEKGGWCAEGWGDK